MVFYRLLLLLLIVNPSVTFAEDFFVYFKDKKYTQYSIDNPGLFLSQRAIDRRNTQNIQIDSLDLPVNKKYCDSIAVLGAGIKYKSRWLNAAYVSASTQVREEIRSLAFIDTVSDVPVMMQNPFTPCNCKITQIDYGSSEEELNQVGIPQMHQSGYTGGDILISVFDSGFENVNNSTYFSHLTSENRIIGTFDFINNDPAVFDTDDHGTRVLSLLAAYKEADFTGGAFDASYLLYQTENIFSEHPVEPFYWILAAERSDSMGADIISSSVGYNTFDNSAFNFSLDNLDGWTIPVSYGASVASTRGIIVVNSAGNEGSNSWGNMLPPSDGVNVIAVGGVNGNGDKVFFSPTGPTADNRIKPDVVALASGLQVVNGSDSKVNDSGNSYSAPVVASLAAGLWQQFPDKTSLEIINLIRNSGSIAGNPNNSLGYGIPSYQEAKNLAVGLSDKLRNNIAIYPNPVQDYLRLDIDSYSNFSSKMQSLSIIDMQGTSKGIFDSDITVLDVSGFKSGVYYLFFRFNDGSFLHKSFIKL